MMVFLDNFHFLRPYWLLTLVPVGFIWFVLHRSQNVARQFGEFIAPHLLNHLMHRPEHRNILRPVHLLLLVWVLLVVAVAGPSWQMEPSPFAEDKAGLMILMKLSPSMKAEDLRPSRLERARHKLHDLFELRTGGTAGLIAYSGSSHLVMPLTEDTRIIEQMAGALDPSVMPVEGDVLAEALALAAEQFARREIVGSVLVITDGIVPAQIQNLVEYAKRTGPPVQILAAAGSRELAAQGGIENGARALGAPVFLMTADDTDVHQIIRQAENQVSAVTPKREEVQWRDGGYFLVPVILLCMLLWARRGWSVRWEY